MRGVLSPALLSEILIGFKVRFPDDNAEPVYMDLENIRRCVAHLHSVNREIAGLNDEELAIKLREFGEELGSD